MEAINDDSSGSPGSAFSEFTYLGSGRIVVEDYVQPDVRLTLDSGSASENTEPESLRPQYQYVWSQRYIDAPVLRDKNTDTDGLCDDERLYCLGDANFNITALIDTSGDALERYVYTPYGVPTIYDATWSNTRSASSYANAYTYTGRQLDAETGLF
ncbi:MAG: hypothetical protein FJ276_37465 [Planctomycetes bacterium]|nr:hypothetical protein [Planctomycetota bacterium]